MVDKPSPKVTPAPTPPSVEAVPVSKPEPTPASKPIAEKPESVLSSTTSPAASKEDVKKQKEEF